MKNILILEDNVAHMEALVKAISDIDEIQIFKAYNMAEACYMLSLNVFHLFLVDIILDTKEKGNLSGIDFVNYIRDNRRYKFTPVVFITALEDPKFCAYRELHCYSYIEKPFDAKCINKIVTEALEFPIRKLEKEYVFFRKDGILLSVKVQEITHIVITKSNTEIYTTNDCLKLGYRTVADMLKKLDSDDFIQCSRNTIINKNYIENVDMTNRYIKLNSSSAPVEIGSIMKKYLRGKI